MARSLTSGMNTAVAAETSTIVHFISITSSASDPNDVIELTTAPVDMSWDSKTWTGIGGALSFETITESPDRKAQGVKLTLGGVDQSIFALLMSYHMRGRVGVIYLAHLSDGDVVATPYEIFRGYLNDDFFKFLPNLMGQKVYWGTKHDTGGADDHGNPAKRPKP